jgi:TonB family protein
MSGQKRGVLLFIILVGAGLFSVKVAKPGPQTTKLPAVVKAVAPTFYPAIAVAARADGKVVIEVQIDAAGKVTSAHAVEGHALLRKAAEETAARWQFEPDAGAAERRVVSLTFIYHIASKVAKGEVVFSPPYQVEVTYEPHMVETTNY